MKRDELLSNTASFPRPLASQCRAIGGAGLLLIACLSLPPSLPSAWAEAPDSAPTLKEEDLLLLEVHIERYVVADGLSAYKSGKAIFLPLGELSRVLSLAIVPNASLGTASGWFIRQDRHFSLSLAPGAVKVDGRSETVDPSSTVIQGDEIYVRTETLAKWLPIDFDVDQPSLMLNVRPREKLPLQEQLARLKQAGRIKEGSVEDPGYARRDVPYKWVDIPFIDQKVGAGISDFNGAVRRNTYYSSYLAGDLFAMEGSLFLAGTEAKPLSTSRLTLERNDPDKGLLGPLRASTVSVGSVALPPQSNISKTSDPGTGFAISNRPFTRLSRFDTYNLSGDLLPGWDVEIFHNSVPVGFQNSRGDGKYEFTNLPLLYGVNDYRLVFHGPLGELREETRRYFLNDSLVQPGEFNYDFGLVSTPKGALRMRSQFDKSVLKNLSMTTAFLSQPSKNGQVMYGQIGTRSFWQGLFLNADLIRSSRQGTLGELGMKTQLGAFTLGASHALVNRFESESIPASLSPLQSRSKARVDFAVPWPIRLPVTLEAQRDLFESQESVYEFDGKISSYLFGTTVTTQAHGTLYAGNFFSSGTLQLSRRVGRMGLKGELGFNIRPSNELTTAGMVADFSLGNGYSLFQALVHSFLTDDYRYGATLSKTLGSYGFGTSFTRSTSGETSVMTQLSISLGVDPREKRVLTDALPITKTGAISARVFRDQNNNGTMDDGEEPVPGIGFNVNGSKSQLRTNEQGVVYLDALPVKQHVNLGIDQNTIDDPELTPRPRGIRLVPRPGLAAMIDLPLIPTIEIDGTFYMEDNGRKHPAGNVEIELVDIRDGDQVIAKTKTASDGFYVLSGVPAGTYQLRVAKEQAERVGIQLTDLGLVSVLQDGNFISGLDRTLYRKPAAPAAATAVAKAEEKDAQRAPSAAPLQVSHYLNLAKFAEISQANSLAEKARARGFSATTPVVPGKWWVNSVKAAELENRVEAENLVSRLKEKGFLPSIVSTKNGFTVFSGRYVTSKDAFEGLDQLELHGFGSGAVESTEEQSPFVEVRVGPFLSVEDARAAIKELSDIAPEAALHTDAPAPQN